MKPIWVISGRLVSAFCILSLASVIAQEPNCHEIAAMAKVARARTSATFALEKRESGDGYRAQVVVAARSFEIRPKDKVAALGLLNLIPQNDAQQLVWMTMGNSMCDTELVTDLMSLGRLGEHLPHDLARAVLLAPAKLQHYVAYAQTSLQDPHSDYAVQMESVCHSQHQGFLKAVEMLPTDERKWFANHVFDSKSCRAIALPEAD